MNTTQQQNYRIFTDEPSQLWCGQLCIAGTSIRVCVMWTNVYNTVTGWRGDERGERKHRRLLHMKTRCKRIRKIKIRWQLYGFPFSVLYGKHSWTYGNIIKMKHWCTTTTTFCDTSTIEIFIILWHFLDVIHTFNNSLISHV